MTTQLSDKPLSSEPPDDGFKVSARFLRALSWRISWIPQPRFNAFPRVRFPGGGGQHWGGLVFRGERIPDLRCSGSTAIQLRSVHAPAGATTLPDFPGRLFDVHGAVGFLPR